MVEQHRPDPVAPVDRPGGPTAASWRARLGRVTARYLPSGRALPMMDWQRRHRGVTRLLWLHVVGVFAFGMWVGAGAFNSLLEAGLVAIPETPFPAGDSTDRVPPADEEAAA